MDRALVDAARSGDEEAFAAIARGSADRLFTVAHRILRDVGRAEDAVQQTLVTAWRELPRLRESRPLRRLDPPDPRQRLLRRGETRLALVRQRRGPADRRARDAGHDAERRSPGPPRARLPEAAARAARGVRAASLPRLAARARSPTRSGSRWEPRSRGSATPPQRSARASRPTRGRRSSSPGGDPHERDRLPTDRSSLARGGSDADGRPRRAGRPRPRPRHTTAPRPMAGAEVAIHDASTPHRGLRGGGRGARRRRGGGRAPPVRPGRRRQHAKPGSHGHAVGRPIVRGAGARAHSRSVKGRCR